MMLKLLFNKERSAPMSPPVILLLNNLFVQQQQSSKLGFGRFLNANNIANMSNRTKRKLCDFKYVTPGHLQVHIFQIQFVMKLLLKNPLKVLC